MSASNKKNVKFSGNNNNDSNNNSVEEGEEISKSEVNRRLRLRNQPIKYFGESFQDTVTRLKRLEQIDLENRKKTKGNALSEEIYSELEEKQNTIIEKETRKAQEKQRIEEEEKKIREESEAAFLKLTPQERKLHELKQKLNQCRQQNITAVAKEEREKIEKSKKGKKKRQFDNEDEEEIKIESSEDEEELTEEEKKKSERIIQELKDRDRSLNLTAEQSEWLEKRKEKKLKKSAPTGHDVFSQENLYKSFKKRASSASHSNVKDYENQKKNMGQEEFYATSDNLNYGKMMDATKIPEKNKDNMVNELLKYNEKKSKFSRRRRHNESADINYINERNKQFNKKVDKAFDKYTQEIKDNIERGTAL